MSKLKVWMRVVGAFYILPGVIHSPFFDMTTKQSFYPTLDLAKNPVATAAIADLWFMFGLELAMVGVMLIIASNAPVRNRILVQTVLLLEVTRGILIDLYWVTRGNYVDSFMYTWVVIHLLIIVTGWRFLREAENVHRQQSVEPSLQPG